MMRNLYVLDEDGRPVNEPDMQQWCEWMASCDRQVADDYVGDIRISTVFLGIDHGNPWRDDEPVLWETMVFGGEHDLWQDRYRSREAALAGHAQALAMVRATLS